MKYDDDILRILEKIGGHISNPAFKMPKITLSPLALLLLERKEAEQAKRKTTENWNHRFPQRQVRKIGEATGCMDFDSAERDYHGYEKPLEIATGGHRLRGLDFLIKSRT